MVSDDDTAYQQLFAHLEMVRELLQGFVAGEWVQQLDFATIERVNGNYISDGGDHRHGDMVWRVRLAGQWVYIYLLLEFQSRSDPWMALRMQVYIGLLYQDLIKRGELPQPGALPPVFPVVLYSGKQRWRAKMNLSELIVPVPDGLQALQAAQSYLLLDIHRLKSSLRKNLVALVFDMERARSGQDLTSLALRLDSAAQRKSGFDLSQSIGVWSTLRLQQLSRRLNITCKGNPGEDVMPRPELKTFAEGLQYGMMLGSQRNRLYFLLRKKFGKVPRRYENQIDNSEMDDLDVWFDRLLDAKTLKELFAEKQPG